MCSCICPYARVCVCVCCVFRVRQKSYETYVPRAPNFHVTRSSLFFVFFGSVFRLCVFGSVPFLFTFCIIFFTRILKFETYYSVYLHCVLVCVCVCSEWGECDGVAMRRCLWHTTVSTDIFALCSFVRTHVMLERRSEPIRNMKCVPCSATFDIRCCSVCVCVAVCETALLLLFNIFEKVHHSPGNFRGFVFVFLFIPSFFFFNLFTFKVLCNLLCFRCVCVCERKRCLIQFFFVSGYTYI